MGSIKQLNLSGIFYCCLFDVLLICLGTAVGTEAYKT